MGLLGNLTDEPNTRAIWRVPANKLFYMYKHICPKHTNLFPQLLIEDSAIQNLAEDCEVGK